MTNTERFWGRYLVYEPVEDPGLVRYAHHIEQPTMDEVRRMQPLGVSGSLAFGMHMDPSTDRQFEEADWLHIFSTTHDAGNRDLDYAMLQRDWPMILDFIYLGTMLYLFYLDREMVELRVPHEKVHMRFADGVVVDLEAKKEHLEVTWGDVTIASGHDRFIPLRGAIYIYSREGGERTWRLPDDWRGVPLDIFGLSRSGRHPPPPHKLTDDDLWINLPPRTPVKLVRKV